jgi:hypothetical protein
MVRPLDHVTVIQQINFAERVHQNLQTHPEVSKLAAEAVDREKRLAETRKTKALHKSERARIHPKEREFGARSGYGKRKSKEGKRPGIDLKA